MVESRKIIHGIQLKKLAVNDLSRAFVDVKIEGVDLATINMFHILCGKPGILGPILGQSHCNAAQS